MTDTGFETSAAVHELLDTMKGLDQEFLTGPKALADDQAVLEGYRWIFSRPRRAQLGLHPGPASRANLVPVVLARADSRPHQR